MKPIVQDQPSIASQAFSHYPALPPPLRIPLTQLGGHPCPYLPSEMASDRAFLADALPGDIYHALMDRGFRRSGKVVYQPACRRCRACTPVRVRVEEFRPTRSMRRCVRRNADLTVTTGPLLPTEEKFELYCRYQQQRHRDEGLDWQAFVDFLYDTPVETREWCYRDGEGRLLAVGICDLSPAALSSVYFYYDPADSRRGLGTFGVLAEIEATRGLELPHYYLGYWVRGCRTMDYKVNFRPVEYLGTDGQWRDLLAVMDAATAAPAHCGG